MIKTEEICSINQVITYLYIFLLQIQATKVCPGHNILQ